MESYKEAYPEVFATCDFGSEISKSNYEEPESEDCKDVEDV